MMPGLVSRSKRRIQRSPGILPYTLTIIASGLAACLAFEGYVSHKHPAVVALSSLLSGFAPIIGLCVFLVIVSLLISYLICTVERMLANEGDGIVREPHLKSKWHPVVHCLPDKLAYRLSLREHSPPAFLS